MNSKFVVLLVVFVSTLSFGQTESSWRDSLKVARKAYENKEYVKALKYYESAQKIAPNDIDLSDEMAQSAYRTRDFERAEKIYQQGSSSKMSKQSRGDAMHNLGNAQMQQKNYEDAIESYKQALRNNPKDEETRYNLSEAVRKWKEEQMPPPQNQNNPNDSKDQKGQDGKNGQKNQGGNKSSQGSSGRQGEKDLQKGQGQQDKNGNSQRNQSKNSKGQNGQGNERRSGSAGDGGEEYEEGQKSKLTNRMVERRLNEIAKKEAETKRAMSGVGGGGRSAKSGKDW